MVSIRARNSDGTSRPRRGLAKVTSLALGIAMFGTVGLSGALAQDEDVSVGIADAETIVNTIIADVFAAVFGGEVAAGDADDAAVSGGSNITTGGSSGSTVTMGGGSDVSIGGGGGSSGGVTVGGPYGG